MKVSDKLYYLVLTGEQMKICRFVKIIIIVWAYPPAPTPTYRAQYLIQGSIRHLLSHDC